MSLPLRSSQDEKTLSIETAISNLFFNMQHKKFFELINSNHPEISDLQEAIEADAAKMRDWLEALGYQVTIEQLINDFFDRF